MASTRLRTAFHYPADSDSDNDIDLDDEHQERLIADLQASDAEKNELYRKLFLAIPAVAILFFLHMLFQAITFREVLIAWLGLSSLVCTGYILNFMPIEDQKKEKKPLYKIEAAKGPVEKYLAFTNAALAALLLVAAAVSWSKNLRGEVWRECLPASKCYSLYKIRCTTNVLPVIFAITMFVRQQLTPIDLQELRQARYELKGA